jgi:hypothetical protein
MVPLRALVPACTNTLEDEDQFLGQCSCLLSMLINTVINPREFKVTVS